MTAKGFDSIDVEKVDTNKYRIVLKGDGLTIDAMLFGMGADTIANAINNGVNPKDLVRQFRPSGR